MPREYQGPEPYRGVTENIGEAPEAYLDLDPQTSAAAEPATPQTYDKFKVQDRTGLIMQATSEMMEKRRATQAQHRIIANGNVLACSNCGNQQFRIFCSSVDNHVQFVCSNRECGAYYPILDITPVQMNDRIAREHGIESPLFLPPGSGHRRMRLR